MFFIFTLSFLNWWRHPGRLVLTGLAIMAAAAVVAWIVAGYDTILAQARDDQGNAFGDADLLVLRPASQDKSLPTGLRDAIAAEPAVSAVTALVSVEVTSRLGGRPGGDRRNRAVSNAPRPEAEKTDQGRQGSRRGGSRGPGPRPGNSSEDRQAESSSTEVLPAPERPVIGTDHSPAASLPAITINGGTASRRAQTPTALPPPSYGLPRRGPAVIGTTAEAPPRSLTGGSWLPRTVSNRQMAAGKTTPETIPCVISDRLAESAGLHVGDTFPIGSLAGTFTLTVTGTIADVMETGLLTIHDRNGEKLHPPPANGILVGWPAAEKIAGGSLAPSCLAIKLRRPDTANAGELANSSGLSLPPDTAWIKVADLLASSQGSQTANFHKMQAYSATGLAMLVSFVIILTSLGMGLDERVRQLAALRTVALTRLQTAAGVVFEAVFLGVIGWAGGLASGWILLAVLPAVSASAGRVAETRIGLWTISLTAVCALLGSLLAAVYPAWRATRIRPLDVMTPLGLTERRRIPHAAVLAALPLLAVNPLVVFLPGLPELVRIRLYAFLGCPAMALAFALLAPAVYSGCRLLFQSVLARCLGLEPSFLRSQLDANLWRASGTVIALSIGLGLTMTILVWSASMLIPFLPGAWMPDMFVAIMPGGISAESLPDVRRLPGIKPAACLPVAVEQVRLAADLTGSAQRQTVTRQDNVIILGLDVETGLAAAEPLLPFVFQPRSDRQRALAELSRRRNACLIPAHFAAAANLKTGDSFAVIPPDRPEHPVTLLVAGIIELKGWHWFSKFSGVRRNASRTAAMIFASDEDTRRNFALDRINYLWFNLEPRADPAAIAASLQGIADRHAGESYHIPGRGNAVIDRQHLQATATAALHQSIRNRTDIMIAGMLKMPFLILLVTSLAVANTAVASLRARRREIGLMRAVGLSGTGLCRLLLGEAAIIALAAAVVSLALALFAGVCGAQMSTHLSFFGGMGWNFAMPWSDLARCLATTLLVCLSAAAPVAVAAGWRRPLSLIE